MVETVFPHGSKRYIRIPETFRPNITMDPMELVGECFPCIVLCNGRYEGMYRIVKGCIELPNNSIPSLLCGTKVRFSNSGRNTFITPDVDDLGVRSFRKHGELVPDNFGEKTVGMIRSQELVVDELVRKANEPWLRKILNFFTQHDWRP